MDIMDEPRLLLDANGKVRSLTTEDMFHKPDREKVHSYGRMYDGILLQEARQANTDIELLIELHRRSAWNFARENERYDWHGEEGAKEKRDDNLRLVNLYSGIWGICSEGGLTVMVNSKKKATEKVGGGQRNDEHRSWQEKLFTVNQKLRHLTRDDLNFKPCAKKVNEYSRMYDRSLLALVHSQTNLNTDIELLMELHRRAAWKFAKSTTETPLTEKRYQRCFEKEEKKYYDWVENDSKKAKRNARLSVEYDERWGIGSARGQTYMPEPK